MSKREAKDENKTALLLESPPVGFTSYSLQRKMYCDTLRREVEQ